MNIRINDVEKFFIFMCNILFSRCEWVVFSVGERYRKVLSRFLIFVVIKGLKGIFGFLSEFIIMM